MSAPRRRARRRLAPEDRRQELKAAGLGVFLTRGFRAAAIADIVAEADAAQGTFYLYYSSKTALFLELLDDFERAILTSFSALDLEVVPVGDYGVERVEALLAEAFRRFFETCRQEKQLAQLFFQESLFDQDLKRRRQEIYESFASLARRGLELGMQVGVLRPLDSTVVAHAIVGMVERVAVQWLLVDDVDETERLVRELSRFGAFGIARR